MLITVIVLFAIAAVLGVTMAVAHLRGQTPPKIMTAALHGLFAASGLVLLLIIVMKAGPNGTGIALGLFLLAALGGFTLLSFHLRSRALPTSLVIGHGMLAVVGFLVLLAVAVGVVF